MSQTKEAIGSADAEILDGSEISDVHVPTTKAHFQLGSEGRRDTDSWLIMPFWMLGSHCPIEELFPELSREFWGWPEIPSSGPTGAYQKWRKCSYSQYSRLKQIPRKHEWLTNFTFAVSIYQLYRRKKKVADWTLVYYWLLKNYWKKNDWESRLKN